MKNLVYYTHNSKKMLYIIVLLLSCYFFGKLIKLYLQDIFISFTKIFKFIFIFSIITSAYAIYSLYYNPSNFSIEFIGGRNIKIENGNFLEIKERISKRIDSASFSEINNQLSIKYSARFQEFDKEIDEIIALNNGTVISDYVIQPALGSEIQSQAFSTLILVLILIGIYIYINFSFYYAIGAVIALVHDLILSTFFIQYLEYEFSIATVTALMIILGYSINDTVVIFNRLRENLKFQPMNINLTIDKSISDTLNRTIMTSTSTLLPVLITFFILSETLKPMMMILFIGFIIGTYSSIFIASPILRIFIK